MWISRWTETRRNCTAEADQRDMKVQNLRSHCDAGRAENCASRKEVSLTGQVACCGTVHWRAVSCFAVLAGFHSHQSAAYMLHQNLQYIDRYMYINIKYTFFLLSTTAFFTVDMCDLHSDRERGGGDQICQCSYFKFCFCTFQPSPPPPPHPQPQFQVI